MNLHYYEVVKRYDENPPDGVDYKGFCIACDDLDEAIKTADENGATIICECGGNWEEFEKCWFCGEWVPTSEINKDALCWRCELALYSRGEL